MSESPAVEIDFFRLADESSSKKVSDRRDIQGVISKINPELLKTAIASANANTGLMANKAGNNQDATVAPMTIFFNGSVLVFEVSPDQAESIMKLAESNHQNQTIGGVLKNDLPLSRKRSLRRFLEKRKERHVCTSPYACSQGSTSSH